MTAANQGIPIIRQTYEVPVTAGRTYAISGLGAISVQVIAADSQRQSLTFHNPNNGDGSNGVNVFVCQAQDASGAALAAAVNGPGCYTVFPGQTITFTGNIAKSAWNAIAAESVSNLTIGVDP